MKRETGVGSYTNREDPGVREHESIQVRPGRNHTYVLMYFRTIP